MPSIVEWPVKLKGNTEINTPLVTSDFYPTLLKICDISMDDQPHIDGENVLPVLVNERENRKKPIGFRSPLPNRLKKQEVQNAEQLAFIDNKYKIITVDNGNTYQIRFNKRCFRN